MNIKLKSITIKNFEQGPKGETTDMSIMTYDQLIEIKAKIAKELNINIGNVTAHYEGRL